MTDKKRSHKKRPIVAPGAPIVGMTIASDTPNMRATIRDDGSADVERIGEPDGLPGGTLTLTDNTGNVPEALRAVTEARAEVDAVESAERTKTEAKRGRGRPRKDASAPPAVATGPQSPPVLSISRTTKEELAAKLATAEGEAEQLRAENARLKMSADQTAVGELAGALAVTAKMGADALANFRGPHWKLQDGEAHQLGEVWAPVLAPYISTFAEALPWMVALGATWGIVGPRLATDREIAAKAESTGAAVAA